jgi:peptidoglycan/LPS O-acetylase OafA/YrhL
MINPTYLLFFFRINSDFITGVQWTLTYEITFYLLLSFIFFKFSKRFAFEIMFWLTNFILTTNYVYLFLNNQIGNGYFVKDVSLPSVEFVIQQSGLLHLSWFLLGMWFFNFNSDSKSKTKWIYFLNLILLCTWDISQGRAALNQLEQAFFSVLLFTIFVISFFFIKQDFSKLSFSYLRRGLELLGNVSYEFYLLHEIVGVTLLVYFSKFTFISSNKLSYPLIISLVILIIYVLSYGINRYFSMPVQEWVKSKF